MDVIFLKKYNIKNEIILIDYLEKNLKYLHKDTKKMLKYNLIKVNNKIINQYNYLLKVNDELIILDINKKIDNIDIIYEDKNIIVVNKPNGLLTISTIKEKEKTLYHLVSEYLKKTNKNAKIFIIHRLDKDTSGIVIFAKTENIKKLYQNNWDSLVKYRGYTCVVEGKPKENNKTITQYLKEDKNFYVYPTNKNDGKLAITNYKVLKNKNNFSLIDIEIKTGRKNQIRVAMKSIGTPIVGDFKYGATNKKYKKLYLCANKLQIINPLNNKLFDFEIEVSTDFFKIVN